MLRLRCTRPQLGQGRVASDTSMPPLGLVTSHSPHMLVQSLTIHCNNHHAPPRAHTGQACLAQGSGGTPLPPRRFPQRAPASVVHRWSSETKCRGRPCEPTAARCCARPPRLRRPLCSRRGRCRSSERSLIASGVVAAYPHTSRRGPRTETTAVKRAGHAGSACGIKGERDQAQRVGEDNNTRNTAQLTFVLRMVQDVPPDHLSH